MQMIELGSSHIAAVGYDAATRTMRIRFPDRIRKGDNAHIKGGVYESAGVPEEAYKALLAAEHKGRFWHSNFRNNPDYRFLRVEEKAE
jgi:hypothetical protein